MEYAIQVLEKKENEIKMACGKGYGSIDEMKVIMWKQSDLRRALTILKAVLDKEF